MLPLAGGRSSSLTLMPLGQLSHVHIPRVRSTVLTTSGTEPILPSAATYEGLGRLCFHTLGLAHPSLCYQDQLHCVAQVWYKVCSPECHRQVRKQGLLSCSQLSWPALSSTEGDEGRRGKGGMHHSCTHTADEQLLVAGGRARSCALCPPGTYTCFPTTGARSTLLPRGGYRGLLF